MSMIICLYSAGYTVGRLQTGTAVGSSLLASDAPCGSSFISRLIAASASTWAGVGALAKCCGGSPELDAAVEVPQ